MRQPSSAAVHQCWSGAAQSTSRFHVLFVGGVGVCHCASNSCPLLTQVQHHFKVKKTVYPSLETNYQVRTVKSHIVLITPALLPWHMFCCSGCLQESMGLPLPTTSAQVCLCSHFNSIHSRHLCGLCSACTTEEMTCSVLPIQTQVKGKTHHLRLTH